MVEEEEAAENTKQGSPPGQQHHPTLTSLSYRGHSKCITLFSSKCTNSQRNSRFSAKFITLTTCNNSNSLSRRKHTEGNSRKLAYNKTLTLWMPPIRASCLILHIKGAPKSMGRLQVTLHNNNTSNSHWFRAHINSQIPSSQWIQVLDRNWQILAVATLEVREVWEICRVRLRKGNSHLRIITTTTCKSLWLNSASSHFQAKNFKTSLKHHWSKKISLQTRKKLRIIRVLKLAIKKYSPPLLTWCLQCIQAPPRNQCLK